MSAMDLRHCLSQKCLSVAGDASSQCLSSVYSSHSTISGHGREDCRIAGACREDVQAQRMAEACRSASGAAKV